MHLFSHLTKNKSARGMTLTESAIVLGVVGLVLGAIWAAATTVSNKNNANEALADMQMIAQNIRKLYSQQSQFTLAANTNITANMITAQIPPARIIRDGELRTTWNSPITITVGPGSQQRFSINYLKNIPSDACHQLALVLTGPVADFGLVEASVNTTTYSASSNPPIGSISPTDIPARCTSLRFTFNLKG